MGESLAFVAGVDVVVVEVSGFGAVSAMTSSVCVCAGKKVPFPLHQGITQNAQFSTMKEVRKVRTLQLQESHKEVSWTDKILWNSFDYGTKRMKILEYILFDSWVQNKNSTETAVPDMWGAFS